MSKFKRHAKILEILARERIFTQEQLLQRLREEGVEVTQATVSRDIRELHLVKAQTPDGAYAYAGTKIQDAQNVSFRFHAIFKEAVAKIDCAQNLVVIKCFNGMANAACAALDTIEWGNLVGTIAGDDTILIIMRDNASATDMVGALYKMLGED